MPRRRLSERQLERIERIQERRRRRFDERAADALAASEESAAREGLVVTRHGGSLAVADEAWQVRLCLARQHIGHAVCGDRVIWQTTGDNRGVVTAIRERQTVLSRRDGSGRDKPIAANLTQMLVLLAPRPEPSTFLLDHYLVAAELTGIEARIVVNKIDLLEDEAARLRFLDLFSRYVEIGYERLATSLKRPDGTAAGCGLGALNACLAGEASILVGQSGVGKSSFVKALLPDQQIQIGLISDVTGLGRHTTSAATCYRLTNGGLLIDSPGVRSFRLGQVSFSELEHGFREFAPYLGRCQFGNCRHDREPGCAIKAAVESGGVHPDRLASFRHMAEGIDAVRRH